MSASSVKPWSDNPYAPQIPHSLYFAEKANFAGVVIGAIFYGIVVVLFFQCMEALLNPLDRGRREMKWGLVAHTTAMFSFVTVYTAMTLNIQSISYIDNREFPGIGEVLPPGPLGYQFSIYSKAISIIPNLTFLLNNWLADGLLLYRCYIIYSMNYWVIAFPCLMYLASIAMGIVLVYQTTQPSYIWNSLAANTGIPYFSISVSLNVLLTLIIVTRLILHSRFLRRGTGSFTQSSGLYSTVITVLVESSAIYAVNSLLLIGPWVAKNRASGIFLPILAETQVIAPFLIITRIAKQSALTGTTVVSGTTSSIRIQMTSASGGETLPDTMSSTDSRGKTHVDAAVETTADLYRNEV